MTLDIVPEPTTAAATAPAADQADLARLREIARRIRVEIVRTIHATGVGHMGGSLSEADLLAALYFGVLDIRPDEPDWPLRDRFVLSKGHASVGLYATLALRGYFPVDELTTFDSLGTRLQGHPDMTRLPGIDMSTGSLGVGISAAVGIALASRHLSRTNRTVVLVGDGECQEGSVWEAAFVAARYRLDGLIAIVDHNRLQQYGWRGDTPDHRLPPEDPGELLAKWSAFGWRTMEIDGHDMGAILEAFRAADAPDGRPVAIIADTIKGRGVSFMENRHGWHVRVPTDEEFGNALAELGEPRPEAAEAPR